MPDGLNLVIEAIGKVAVEAVAMLVLAFALYIFAQSFKKIADSFEQTSKAWLEVNTTLGHVSEGVRELISIFKEGKGCPYNNKK